MNLDTVKSSLLARKAELEARAHRLDDDLAEPLSADWEEQATEREDDEALAGQLENATQEIHAIDAALIRIDNGHYGVCTVCGTEIALARLEAIPTAAMCIGCASTRQ